MKLHKKNWDDECLCQIKRLIKLIIEEEHEQPSTLDTQITDNIKKLYGFKARHEFDKLNHNLRKEAE